VKEISDEVDWTEQYNKYPDTASAFKGRALLRFRVEQKRPPRQKLSPLDKSFILKVRERMTSEKEEKREKERRRRYTLQAVLLLGSELPPFNFSVQISIGTPSIY
jgi:hypothetical protein